MRKKIDKKLALDMYQDGASYDEIADKMGATRSAVSAWFYRHRDICPKRSREWTAKDFAVLRSLYATGGNGRSIAAVVGAQRGEKLTPYDVDILIICAASREHLTAAEWRAKYGKR